MSTSRLRGHLGPRRNHTSAVSQQQETVVDDSPTLLQRRWAPYAVIAATLAIACVDGAVRAQYGASELMGEDPAGYMRSADAVNLRTHSTAGRLHFVGSHGQALHQGGPGESCEFMYNCISTLVCREGLCQPCVSTDECQLHSPELQCFNATGHELHTSCRHKPMFFPFSVSDVALILITLFTIVFTAPTGAGGGGILVPLFMFVGAFSPHSAVPLSKAAIVGGALTNNFLNLQHRHPFANRPLLDYEALETMIPTLLIGTVLGVFFNAVSPSWLITLGLFLALTWSMTSSFSKTFKLYKEENAEGTENQSLLGKGSRAPPAQHYSFDLTVGMDPELAAILEEESRHNFKALGVVLGAWVIVAVCEMLKGGGKDTSFFHCGSLGFYVFWLVPLPIVILMSWYNGWELQKRYERKVACGYRFADGDVHWRASSVRFYSGMGIICGACAGSLGIAAGTLVGPLLLQFGMNPQVAVASSAFMVLFTASSTTFQYYLLGRLLPDYALVFGSVGLLGGAIGNLFLGYIIRKTRKTWILVGALAMAIAVSSVLLLYTGVTRAIVAFHDGENMGFSHICGEEGESLARIHQITGSSALDRFREYFPRLGLGGSQI